MRREYVKFGNHPPAKGGALTAVQVGLVEEDGVRERVGLEGGAGGRVVERLGGHRLSLRALLSQQ